MSEAALSLESVSAGYPGRPILAEVSLTVRRGEFLGILGPNGCGKTTLLRAVTGLLGPTSGRVVLGGVDVATLSPREIAQHVSTLPQEGGPVFSLSALEAVLMGRFPWHPAFAFESVEDLECARAALAEVDAAHLEDRDITTLSGGERQRVLLARALCQGGELLLCDEPTAHLDMRHQAATFRLLRQLCDGGRTAVVVTHDVNLAARACDRLALLGPGGLVAVGPPEEVVVPDHLEAAFGIETSVERGADGKPRVIRRL